MQDYSVQHRSWLRRTFLVQKIIQVSAHWSVILLQDHTQWKESQGTFSTCGYAHHSTPEAQPCLAVCWWELQWKNPPLSQKECWGKGAPHQSCMDLDIPEAIPCLYTGTKDTSSFASAHKRCSLFPTPAIQWGSPHEKKWRPWTLFHGQWLRKYSWLELCYSSSQLHDETPRRWAVLSGSSAGGAPLPLHSSTSEPHQLKQSTWDFYITAKLIYSWP